MRFFVEICNFLSLSLAEIFEFASFSKLTIFFCDRLSIFTIFLQSFSEIRVFRCYLLKFRNFFFQYRLPKFTFFAESFADICNFIPLLYFEIRDFFYANVRWNSRLIFVIVWRTSQFFPLPMDEIRNIFKETWRKSLFNKFQWMIDDTPLIIPKSIKNSQFF